MEKRKASLLKVIFILNALMLFFIFNASNAFAEFYVISGSRGVGTEIKSLPYTISSPGFYYITKDLTCAYGNHGISVESDNVTIDLMGFSIIGSPGVAAVYDGIYMNTRENVEIRNGTVRNFSRNGINEPVAGKGHRIINIRVKDNSGGGIVLKSEGNIVERCTAEGNINTGIYVWWRSTVTGNVCTNNGNHGIFTSSYSTVSGNTCINNGLTQAIGHGIAAGTCATVTGNNCSYNHDDGINTSTGSTVTGNTCDDNTDDGIEAGLGSTVVGNTCRNNNDYGIKLGGFNLVDQNTATSNAAGKDIEEATGSMYGVNVPHIIPTP